MILKSTALQFYKQRWVQEELSRVGDGREVAFKYGKDGFGKRPDFICYPNDAFEMAKRGATSYHFSEERWTSPLELQANMRRSELDNLRYAWDFIIDIDSKDWRLSRVAGWLIWKVLKEDFGISNVSGKFSGNKGFHIAVPWESLPEQIDDKWTRDMFPEWPKAMANYLLKVIKDKYLTITEEYVDIAGKLKITHELIKSLDKDKKIWEYRCVDCHNLIARFDKEYYEYVCPKCENRVKKDYCETMICEKCDGFMEVFKQSPKVCRCGSRTPPKKEFNILCVIDVDTLLLSSRHLFRSPYSLHEKSLLVSVPVRHEDILDFDKETACPNKLQQSDIVFMDRDKSVPGEASTLLRDAVVYQEELDKIDKERREKMRVNMPHIEGHIPKEYFPPCILSILEGIDDGKKRAMFVLTNFLRSSGWTDEMIEVELEEWSARCKSPLRKNVMIGHIRHHRDREQILPPNCNNHAYYTAFGVCKPDWTCKKISNPVNYARIKYTQALREGEKNG